jgi:hypothetical protein
MFSSTSEIRLHPIKKGGGSHGKISMTCLTISVLFWFALPMDASFLQAGVSPFAPGLRIRQR